MHSKTCGMPLKSFLKWIFYFHILEKNRGSKINELNFYLKELEKELKNKK